jgi:hypothetical protein
MADWREADEVQDPWPVKFPVKTPPREASRRFREHTPSRWLGIGKVDVGEVQKRLLGLLFAVEIGVVIAAACVLPLAFLNLTIGEEGIVGAIMGEVGAWLGMSRQAVCLILGLPLPILILTLSLNLGLYRWLQRQSKG